AESRKFHSKSRTARSKSRTQHVKSRTLRPKSRTFIKKQIPQRRPKASHKGDAFFSEKLQIKLHIFNSHSSIEVREVMDMDFDELYEQEFRKTYQYIRYMVSNAQVAEDLTQDTFMRIYKTDLIKVTNFQTYTRQVARNLVYDYYRKKALIKWLPFTNAPEQHDFHYVPHEWLIQEEDRKRLYEALQKLKPVQREVIIYRKIEELSIQE